MASTKSSTENSTNYAKAGLFQRAHRSCGHHAVLGMWKNEDTFYASNKERISLSFENLDYHYPENDSVEVV